MRLLLLGDRRVVEHFDIAAVLNETAYYIVDMPACDDYQHACGVSKARAPVISEPMPDALALGLARGLGTAPHRVVDHAEVKLHAVDGAAYSGVAERA